MADAAADRATVAVSRLSAPAETPAPADARLLVCVDAGPGANYVVRAGARLAERLRASWTALYVRTARHDRLPEEDKERVAAALSLAESLGAESVTVAAQFTIGREIADYARARNVTHVVLGLPRPGLVRRLLAEQVVAEIGRLAGNFEIVLVSRSSAAEGPERRRPAMHPPERMPWRDFALATVGVAAATVVAASLERIFSVAHLSFIYLIAVLLIASRFGVWPALYASAVCLASFAYFFAPPYYSLWAVNEQDVLTMALFLLVATLTGNLAGRLKRQLDSARTAARITTNLYELSRKITAAASLDEVLSSIVQHLAAALESGVTILLPKSGGLHPVAGHPPGHRLGDAERAAAEALWRGEARASLGAASPSAWVFVPLRTRRGTVGVLGVSGEHGVPLAPERRRLLDAMANQAAVAIERTLLMMDIEDARLLSETERLRAALLSSVSHDLKTPLVSIIGAATALSGADVALAEPARRTLIQAVLDEAVRLHRFVQNLLDMTRLSYGALQINRRWCELGEIIGRARRETGKALSRHRLEVIMPDEVPELYVDPVLIERVLVNLLDNAGKYAPAGTRIGIVVRVEEQAVAFDVTDQGPGIPESEREAVFDHFYRVRAEDRQVSGTGLGLSICRGFVDAHGGTIAIGAGPAGQGTCVTVTLPREAAAIAAPRRGEEPATEGIEP